MEYHAQHTQHITPHRITYQYYWHGLTCPSIRLSEVIYIFQFSLDWQRENTYIIYICSESFVYDCLCFQGIFHYPCKNDLKTFWWGGGYIEKVPKNVNELCRRTKKEIKSHVGKYLKRFDDHDMIPRVNAQLAFSSMVTERVFPLLRKSQKCCQTEKSEYLIHDMW